MDRAFVAYVDSDKFGRGTFGSYLAGWMADRGVTDLFTVSGSAQARAPTIRRNAKFIAEQRNSMRDQLHRAACTGQLTYHNGPMVDVFVPDGVAAATLAELDALDD